MHGCSRITFHLRDPAPITFQIKAGAFDVSQNYYDGAYEITPSDEEQILPTAELAMRRNVTIHKIPNNYGHIEYDGFGIRVF